MNQQPDIGNRFAEKVAIITGATGGIGEATDDQSSDNLSQILKRPSSFNIVRFRSIFITPGEIWPVIFVRDKEVGSSMPVNVAADSARFFQTSRETTIMMIKKLTITFTALLIFMAMPAFAAPGCKNGKFVGSYTSPSPAQDVFGDTTAIHAYAFQLSLNSDGTASQFWTGLPDYQSSLGTGSSWIGSWKCRNDGKLVVTLLRATYLPTNNPNVFERPDIELVNHVRNTYLFSVVDDNTLNRVQGRARVYAPSADPTDATGGTLGALSTAVIEYKRLIASDADLLAP